MHARLSGIHVTCLLKTEARVGLNIKYWIKLQRSLIVRLTIYSDLVVIFALSSLIIIDFDRNVCHSSNFLY